MSLSEQTYRELEAASDKIARDEEKRREEEAGGTISKNVMFYVCPTEGCPHYYGTPNMGDLSQEWTGTRGINGEYFEDDRARTRADCGTCHEAGRGRVPMCLVLINVNVPKNGPAPVPRPESGRHAPLRLVSEPEVLPESVPEDPAIWGE